MIHVCYGLYDKDGKYSKFVGTSMLSIFENTSADVTVHILHDNTLTIDNRDKFIYIAGQYGQQVQFYNVDIMAKYNIEKINLKIPNINKTTFSIATMYRLMISEIISKNVNKIIYFDADIIVNRNIERLWNININEYFLAAMPEKASDNSYIEFYPCRIGIVKRENYFNAGMLIINLNKIRNENINLINESIEFLAKYPQCTSYDQDFLNVFFNEKYYKLTADFDHLVDYARMFVKPNVIKPEIYHFVHVTLQLDINDVYNKMYFEYFSKTPWFNVDMIGNISEVVHGIYNQMKMDMLSITKIIAGKTRAFFTEPNNKEAIKQIFQVAPNEEIITPPLQY